MIDQRGKRISDARDRVLTLHGQGMNSVAIAQELGLSRQTVSQHLRSSGKDPRAPMKERHEEIAALFVAGMTTKDIAKSVGFSVPHIYNILRKHGLKPVMGRRTDPSAPGEAFYSLSMKGTILEELDEKRGSKTRAEFIRCLLREHDGGPPGYHTWRHDK